MIENSRVVNVSSTSHKSGKIDFNDLDWKKRTYKKMRACGDSKIANIYFTYELQRKLERAGLIWGRCRPFMRPLLQMLKA
jgi:NAD(P)-dependent dehydrogenase (short-subunit alcohol dehydrogenase family)